jgi:hypothetical protein
MAYPPEDDFQLGYESAFNDLMHQVWAASPEAGWASNAAWILGARDDGAKVINVACAPDHGNQGSHGDQR